MRYFMIDRITRWEVGAAAEAVKNVALSEDFFDDHFPRRPIMPGALTLEGMAQLAGLLLESSLKARFGRDARALMSVLERTRFTEPVRPGDRLTYRAEVVSLNRVGGKAAVKATRDGREVASSAIVFAFVGLPDARLDQTRRELMSIWMAPQEEDREE